MSRKLHESWFKRLKEEYEKNEKQLPPLKNKIWHMYGPENVHKLRRVASSELAGFKHAKDTVQLNLPPFSSRVSSRPSSVPNTPLPKFDKKISSGEAKSLQTPATEEKRPRSSSTPPRKKKKWKSRRQREREKLAEESSAYGDEWGLPFRGGKLRRKKRTKRKSLVKKKKTKKRRTKKRRTKKRRTKKHNKCVKFFTKRHRVTKKKALKMCKMMFG